MKRRKITGGVVMLDDDWVSKFKAENGKDFAWHATPHGAMTTIYSDGKAEKLLLHRWLLDARDDLVVEFADGNKLNCTRSNMRLVKRGQRRKPRGRYKGVACYRKRRWQAVICHEGKRKHLGYFDKAKDAAKAYDEAAVALHGPFAVTNKRLNLL